MLKRGISCSVSKRPQLFCMIFGGFLTLTTGAYANVIVGTPNDVNCDPFTCNESGNDSGVSIDYMQVYSSTTFSAPISIGSLTFYDNLYKDIQPATVLSGNYKITIGTTTDNLGTSYPIGMTNTQTFFNGHLGGSIGSSFTIAGSAYSYNPSAGNLVVDIIASGQPNVGNGPGAEIGYLDSDSSGTSSTRAFDFTGHGSFQDHIALVTGFGAAQGVVSPVPLPPALPMFGAAVLTLVAAGYSLKRKGVRTA